LSNTQRWYVHLSKPVFYAIKGQPPSLFDKYVDAVAAVNEIAETYSKHPIESCQGGFLIGVKGEKIALRCAIVGHKKEIHIIQIIEYE